MKKIKTPLPILAIIFFALFSNTVMADEHSGYVHALKNLRGARWLIDNHGSAQQTDDEIAAMKAIEISVAMIIRSNIDDGKYYKDKPDLDGMEIIDRQARLDRAVELLRKARTDINHDDSMPIESQLKEKVIANIDEALRLTEKVMASR